MRDRIFLVTKFDSKLEKWLQTLLFSEYRICLLFITYICNWYRDKFIAKPYIKVTGFFFHIKFFGKRFICLKCYRIECIAFKWDPVENRTIYFNLSCNGILLKALKKKIRFKWKVSPSVFSSEMFETRVITLKSKTQRITFFLQKLNWNIYQLAREREREKS